MLEESIIRVGVSIGCQSYDNTLRQQHQFQVPSGKKNHNLPLEHRRVYINNRIQIIYHPRQD